MRYDEWSADAPRKGEYNGEYNCEETYKTLKIIDLWMKLLELSSSNKNQRVTIWYPDSYSRSVELEVFSNDITH